MRACMLLFQIPKIPKLPSAVNVVDMFLVSGRDSFIVHT